MLIIYNRMLTLCLQIYLGFSSRQLLGYSGLKILFNDVYKICKLQIVVELEGLQFFKYLNHKISHFEFSDVKTIKEKAELMQPYSTFQNNACANMGPNFRNFKYLANR